MDEYTGKRKLADETPVISTGSDALEMLSKQSVFSDEARQVLRDILKWARLDKDLGTYYLREELDDEGNVVKQSGMLQYLTPESIVHHSLNNTSTSTTRLSGTRPNMQNLPRGDDNEFYKSRVKETFTSRFGADGYIIEADYKALEVVTLACMSGDPNLIKALLEDTDMHCLRLSKKLGESYESVLEKCSNKEHPEHKKYKQMRTDIKPPSFAYQYGATAMGISFSTGMPVEEAELFIQNEKELFPGVESFYAEKVFPQVEQSIKRRREQMDDGSFRLFGVGTWTSPAGTSYEFRQYPKTRWANGQRLEVMEFKPTQMRNYPIQGESGYFVQVIGGMLIRWLIANNFFEGKCLMINQVHDAFYFDVHKDVLDTVAPVIKQIMEYLPTYFAQRGYSMPVPFPAEVEYGPSMADKKKYEPKKESA
jgi:DNA polymerase I-like protein with 3'-5' exonuclease and polymerase domains